MNATSLGDGARGLAAVAAIACVFGAPALADDDTAAIRAEIKAMRADYESRLSGLEARLKAAEAAAADAKARADAAEAAAAAAPPAPVAEPEPILTPAANPGSTGAAGAAAFNPGISVVLNGFYTASSSDPDHAVIPGFPLDKDALPTTRGFSLGESELTLASNIDPYLAGTLVATIDREGEVNVEEAYINTTSLGGGLSLKAGRFFSGVGYLNERHSHNWTFSDMPLPYRAFLGGQYGDDGVQVRWLAPTDTFLELGAEAFRGDSFPAGGAADHGAGTYTAYVHSGGDLSTSWSWLAGASYLHADANARDAGGGVFDGSSQVGILSGVAKWAPNGNPVNKNVVLSAEYFFDHDDGSFNAVPVSLDRSGWYVQGVYQFRRRWSAGLRYAALDGDAVPLALAGSALDPQGRSPWAATALLEFDTSEFGRFRLQYTRDESNLQPRDEIMTQYTIIYGPHAAHRY
jgi:hypothetical protein